MSHCYASLVSNIPNAIAETSYQYQYLTERHIQAMWFEQKYFRSLVTSTGEPIHVISPGIWNGESGPDFLKAHLKIGSVEYRGDVEIHLMDEGWHQHHHDLDDRYNQVILHVSLWQPKQPKPIVTKTGHQIIQTHLEQFLTIPHTRILQLIDLDLYPYKKFIGSGRCARTLFRTLSEEKAVDLFKGAAELRLTKKRSYLQAHAETPALQHGAGMAMVLGYKNNAEAFRQLFLWLYGLNLAHEDEYLAIALRTCGFFTDVYQKKWRNSDHYNYLLELSNRLALSIPIFSIKLELNKIRPLNHPIRRFVVMAKLLTDPSFLTLHERLNQCWETEWEECRSKQDWKHLVDMLHNLLPRYEDMYWNRHFSFEAEGREDFLTLLGEDLKNEILVNTCLPLMHGPILDRGNFREIEAFGRLYAAIPASKTSKTRYLIHRFFGDTPKGSVLNKAQREQGAYQLHRDFCMHYEASCEGCPFVERYNASPLCAAGVAAE